MPIEFVRSTVGVELQRSDEREEVKLRRLGSLPRRDGRWLGARLNGCGCGLGSAVAWISVWLGAARSWSAGEEDGFGRDCGEPYCCGLSLIGIWGRDNSSGGGSSMLELGFRVGVYLGFWFLCSL